MNAAKGRDICLHIIWVYLSPPNSLPCLKASLSCLGRIETKNLYLQLKASQAPSLLLFSLFPSIWRAEPSYVFFMPSPLFHRHLLISMYYVLGVELKTDPFSSRDLQSNKGVGYVSIS